jgi:hypothetical protein
VSARSWLRVTGPQARLGRWVALCSALAGIVTVSLASAAPVATWMTQTTPGPSGPPDAALTGVSCVSATFCMAVGESDYGLDRTQEPLGLETFAERWDGSAWTVIQTPVAGPNPELKTVSCASATFCVAVGENAGKGFNVRNARALVEVWNGASWTIQPSPAGSRSGGLAGVSCVSSSFCVAVGTRFALASGESYPVSVVWNGTRGKEIKIPAARYHSELSAISCVAATRCTAVGSHSVNKTGVEEVRPLAERWNGRSWTIDRPPAELDRYHGRLYRNNSWLTAVSCPSRSSCLASGDAERAQQGIGAAAYVTQWHGKRWTRATAGLPRHSPFSGVSCLSSRDCYAAGQFDNGVFPAPATQQPLMEHWNGASWTRITLPHVPTAPGVSWTPTNLGYPILSDVSCVLGAGCTAVGSQAQGSDAANLAQSDTAPPALLRRQGDRQEQVARKGRTR